MDLTVEQMQAFRAKLLEARYSGVREVNFEGQKVVYASGAELAAAIADLEARLAAAVKPRSRLTRPYAVKDL